MGALKLLSKPPFIHKLKSTFIIIIISMSLLLSPIEFTQVFGQPIKLAASSQDNLLPSVSPIDFITMVQFPVNVSTARSIYPVHFAYHVNSTREYSGYNEPLLIFVQT